MIRKHNELLASTSKYWGSSSEIPKITTTETTSKKKTVYNKLTDWMDKK
jgi:hypothetical protein